MKITSILQKKGLNKHKMSNFIEINSGDNQVLINLNFVTSIRHTQYLPNDLYVVYLFEDEYYHINKEQYEEIKAKLIDNNSKE